MTLHIDPIGIVQKEGSNTVIQVEAGYREALLGLEGFSHIILIYWFDRNDRPERRAVRRVHPRGNPANPLTGVFGTRSPRRPNPIGLDVVRLLSVEDDRLRIDRTDAFAGTPVIDIKPYIQKSDAVSGTSVPAWIHRDGGGDAT